MSSTETADEPMSVGRDVFAPDGTKLGTITHVYGPAGNSDETWIAVDAGNSDGPYLVPCDGAGLFSEGLQVRRSVEEVQASPHVVAGDDLSDAQLAELSDYYGVASRTSLHPGSSEADEMPTGQSAPERPSARDAPVRGSGGGAVEQTDPVDGQPVTGAVRVSGAHGDVDVTEPDTLRTSRAAARSAAGYEGGAGSKD